MKFFMAFVIGLLLLPSSGCGKTAVTTQPQIAVAQYGMNILRAVRQGQEAVISLNHSQPSVMTDDKTRKTLDAIKVVTSEAEKLRDLLVEYDAVSSIDLKRLQARDIANAATAVADRAAAAFKIDIPPQFLSSINAATVNIIEFIDAIKKQMAAVSAASKE